MNKEKILQEKNIFTTSDLPLCVALRCYGYEIEAINRQDSQKVEFLFRRDKALDGLIQNFWKHQLRVEPAAFFNLLKETKSQIYSGKKEC